MSCYARCFDYKRFKKIADENGSILMADMSHISGLVAAGKKFVAYIHKTVYKKRFKNNFYFSIRNFRILYF